MLSLLIFYYQCFGSWIFLGWCIMGLVLRKMLLKLISCMGFFNTFSLDFGFLLLIASQVRVYCTSLCWGIQAILFYDWWKDSHEFIFVSRVSNLMDFSFLVPCSLAVMDVFIHKPYGHFPLPHISICFHVEKIVTHPQKIDL